MIGYGIILLIIFIIIILNVKSDNDKWEYRRTIQRELTKEIKGNASNKKLNSYGLKDITSVKCFDDKGNLIAILEEKKED